MGYSQERHLTMLNMALLISDVIYSNNDFSFGGQTSLPQRRLDIDSVLPTLSGLQGDRLFLVTQSPVPNP